MATVKRFDSTYTIDGPDVYVTGNLNVQGAQTSISTTNTTINDRVITLNDGETLNGVGGNVAGIDVTGFEFNRGTNPLGSAYLFFKEITDTFVISVDGGVNWEQIITAPVNVGNVFVGYMTAVADDPAPTLGGNIDTSSYEIFSSYGNVIFNDELAIINSPITPTASANATVFYSSTPGSGTTGLYVVNDSAANEELVTKRRAFGFSLIL